MLDNPPTLALDVHTKGLGIQSPHVSYGSHARTEEYIDPLASKPP